MPIVIRQGSPRVMIVGNGPQGITTACALRRSGMPAENITILDPHPEAGQLLRRQMENSVVGSENKGDMPRFRSGWKASCDPDDDGLRRFAEDDTPSAIDRDRIFKGNPPVSMFWRHADHMVARYRLAASMATGWFLGASTYDGQLRIETTLGEFSDIDHLVLALGNPALNWPTWAQTLEYNGSRNVHHISDSGFRRNDLPAGKDYVIIGGGITAIQTALAMAKHSPGRVKLIARRPIQISELDFSPAWLEEATVRTLDTLFDTTDDKIDFVQANRSPGSVPAALVLQFFTAVRNGDIGYSQGETVRSAREENGRIVLWLDRSGYAVHTDYVLLGTGSRKQLPGDTVLPDLIQGMHLLVTVRGNPRLNPDLSWQSYGEKRYAVFVTGGLAFGVVGASAANIAGGQRAARLIARGILNRSP